MKAILTLLAIPRFFDNQLTVNAFKIICIAIAISVFSGSIQAQTWSTPVTTEPLNGTGGSSAACCPLLVNGKPAMFFWDVGRDYLMYNRAMDTNGTIWGQPVRLDGTPDYYSGNISWGSACIVNGNPAIAYYEYVSQKVKYIRANDIDGSTWGSPDYIIDYQSSEDAVSEISLIVANGNPAIAYTSYDFSGYNVKFIRSTDPNGNNWGDPQIISALANYVFGFSMTVVNGNPAIAYEDWITGYLKYIRAMNSNGTNWGNPQTLDATTKVSRNCSLSIINGKPAVSYIDYTKGNLKYIIALDTNGDSWGSSKKVENIGAGIQLYDVVSSLFLVNGNPAIAYWDETFTLKYVRSSDATGSTWPTAKIIDDSSSLSFRSLLIINNNPAILYTDLTEGKAKYCRATNINGTSWGQPITQEVSATVGRKGLSFIIANGNPAIAFSGETGLKFNRSLDSDGTQWNNSLTIVATDAVITNTSMCMMNGKPAIAYGSWLNSYPYTNYGLRFIYALNSSGTSWSTPQVVDSEFSGSDISLCIVNGNPAIAYTQYNSLSNYPIKYIRSNNSNGTAWSNPKILGNGGGAFLNIVNGNPAIVSNRADTGIVYIRATDANGDSWGTAKVLDNPLTRGGSLCIVNGNPAVSFCEIDTVNAENNVIKYKRSIDANGDVWSNSIILDSASFIYGSTLRVVNGYPAILFDHNYVYDGATGETSQYIRASDINGSYWSDNFNPLPFGIGENTHMAIFDNGDIGIVFPSNLNDYDWEYFIKGTCIDAGLPILTSTVNPLCLGSNATLSIASGTLNNATKWKWYSGSCGGSSVGSGTSISVSPAFTTTYYARGEGGCAVAGACGNITLSTTNPPIATINPTGTVSICSDVSTPLSANTGSNLTYQWFNNGAVISGATTATYNVFSAGSYTVQVTNSSGCSKISVATTVIVNPSPTATITPTGTISICSGENTTLTANSGSGLIWQWLKDGVNISGATSKTYKPTMQGDYKVKVTNSSGCSKISSATTVNVNALPFATITPAGTVSICTGTSTTLTANTGTGLTYKWLKDDVLISSATNSTYTTSVDAKYKVEVTNASGCILKSDATTVSVIAIPTAIISPAGTVNVCEGITLTLTASSSATGITFKWLKDGTAISGATAKTYKPTTSGQYKVKITNTTGCSKTSTATTVNVNALPSAIITPSGTVSICNGATTTLTANAGSGLTYKWLKDAVLISGATNATYTTNTTENGNYTVTVTNASACSLTSDATTVKRLADPNAEITILDGGNLDLCLGEVKLKGPGTAGTSWLWFKGSSSIAGATDQNYLPTTAGTYKVEVTNTSGCTKKSDNGVVVVKTCKESLSADDETQITATIYPNPTAGTFEVSLSNLTQENIAVTILNLLGQAIYNKKYSADEFQRAQTISLSDVSDGIYLVKILMGEKVVVKQVVVQR